MKFTISPTLIRQYVIVTLVNCGSLTTGISMAWPSPMIVKLQNGTDTPLSRPITDEEGSWIVSGGYLIAILTNFLGGILMDKIGRKYCIILVTIPRVLASIWIIFVTEVWMVTLCRAVMVLTDCFIFICVPVYVSEIASKEHRGALGTFVHISSCVGIVITLAVGPFLTYAELNIFLATVIVLTALPLPFIPDSPVYLHSKGYLNDSIEILSKIRNSDEVIKQEIEDYKSSKEVKVDKVALLKDKIFLKSVALGILICGGANAIGYNAVSFYLQTILGSTQTSVQPEVASVVIGIIQIIAAFCTTFMTKGFGRRPILIYSMVGMFLGMLGLGIFFKISTTPGHVVTGFLNYLPIICLILTTYCFNVGIGCLVFVLTAELFDGPARAFGYSICLMSAFLLAFLTSKYFAEMTTALGPSETYWFFSAICFLISTTPGHVVTGFLNYLPIICLILTTYCFNVGIGCLVFVLTAELFDGPARAFGYSICLMSAFLLAFLTSKYFAEMTTALGPSETYWFFSAICFLVGTLIFFFIPETKGKTFGEIQIALGRKNVATENKEQQKQDC